jgi:hypothetical protein
VKWLRNASGLLPRKPPILSGHGMHVFDEPTNKCGMRRTKQSARSDAADAADAARELIPPCEWSRPPLNFSARRSKNTSDRQSRACNVIPAASKAIMISSAWPRASCLSSDWNEQPMIWSAIMVRAFCISFKSIIRPRALVQWSAAYTSPSRLTMRRDTALRRSMALETLRGSGAPAKIKLSVAREKEKI